MFVPVSSEAKNLAKKYNQKMSVVITMSEDTISSGWYGEGKLQQDAKRFAKVAVDRIKEEMKVVVTENGLSTLNKNL